MGGASCSTSIISSTTLASLSVLNCRCGLRDLKWNTVGYGRVVGRNGEYCRLVVIGVKVAGYGRTWLGSSGSPQDPQVDPQGDPHLDLDGRLFGEQEGDVVASLIVKRRRPLERRGRKASEGRRGRGRRREGMSGNGIEGGNRQSGKEKKV